MITGQAASPALGIKTAEVAKEPMAGREHEQVKPPIAGFVPIFLFLAAQTGGFIWWAATMTADIRNMTDLMKLQDVRQAAQIEQIRRELESVKIDQRTQETYNQQLRERLAARGILGK